MLSTAMHHAGHHPPPRKVSQIRLLDTPQPGGKAGLNAKRMPFDDGKFGVKYTDPNGGMGGIIGPDGKVVSFWYSDAH
jgi:hypothetical protein